MNKDLMKKENNYNTYVKVMYEGLLIGSLKHSKDDILYRGSRMTRNEIDNIKKSFEEWNKMEDKRLPKFLLYSRTFLSFTKIEAKIKRFLGETNEVFYGVVFILKNNKNIINKYSSNADIEYLSKYPGEKEVIFFPYTTFCLKNIFEKKYQNQNCIFIELDYLGQYEFIFEQFKKNEEFQNDFIKSIYFYGINYSNHVIKSGLLPMIGNNENNDNNIEDDNSDKEKTIKIMNKILFKVQNQNKDLITINFEFSGGAKYEIQCNPIIRIDELITYFLESLNSKINLNDLKDRLLFICNGLNLNVNSSKTIKEMKIDDGSIVIVIDQKNSIGDSDYIVN